MALETLTTGNTRDKMLILAMLWIATLTIVIVGLLCWAGKYVEATALFSVVSTIAGTFAGAYKGLPSPDSASPTATVTSTTETSTKETVSDQKGVPE